MDSKIKILITGHTSPMGSAVYDYYKQKHEVLGVSKNEGFDFTKNHHQDQIVDMALARDVFLNIAHVGTAQSTLMMKLKQRWSPEAPLRKVITVGSLATKVDEKLLEQVNIDKQYLKDKQHIDAVSNSITNEKPFGEQLHYTLVRVLNYGEKTGDRAGEPTCSVEDICRTFDYIINEPMYIGKLDIRRN